MALIQGCGKPRLSLETLQLTFEAECLRNDGLSSNGLFLKYPNLKCLNLSVHLSDEELIGLLRACGECNRLESVSLILHENLSDGTLLQGLEGVNGFECAFFAALKTLKISCYTLRPQNKALGVTDAFLIHGLRHLPLKSLDLEGYAFGVRHHTYTFTYISQ
jgi:hypothetical protein